MNMEPTWLTYGIIIACSLLAIGIIAVMIVMSNVPDDEE